MPVQPAGDSGFRTAFGGRTRWRLVGRSPSGHPTTEADATPPGAGTQTRGLRPEWLLRRRSHTASEIDSDALKQSAPFPLRNSPPVGPRCDTSQIERVNNCRARGQVGTSLRFRGGEDETRHGPDHAAGRNAPVYLRWDSVPRRSPSVSASMGAAAETATEVLETVASSSSISAIRRNRPPQAAMTRGSRELVCHDEQVQASVAVVVEHPDRPAGSEPRWRDPASRRDVDELAVADVMEEVVEL